MPNLKNPEKVVPTAAGFSYVDRITNHAGTDITQAGITSISRKITNTRTGNVVTDAISKTTAVFDTLQTNTTISDTAYNFKDDVPADKITSKGVRYTLRYTFTPTNGAVFKTEELDVYGIGD